MKYFQFVYSRALPRSGKKQAWFALCAEAGKTAGFFSTDPEQALEVAAYVLSASQGKVQSPKMLSLDTGTLVLTSSQTDLTVAVNPSQGAGTSERFGVDEYQRMMQILALGITQSQLTGDAHPLAIVLEGRTAARLGGDAPTT